jgi:hypothetical protein
MDMRVQGGRLAISKLYVFLETHLQKGCGFYRKNPKRRQARARGPNRNQVIAPTGYRSQAESTPGRGYFVPASFKKLGLLMGLRALVMPWRVILSVS